MKFKNIYLLIPGLLILFLLNACGALKYKPVSAKDYPPDPELRVKKNIEEGRGFRVGSLTGNKGTTYEFASANPLWRASLDTLDFMPLATANYSGGIIVTDWYSENSNEKEAVKISIRFLTNEIRSDALDINIFVKKCDEKNQCITSNDEGDLLASLKKNILKKAAVYDKLYKDKNFKEYKGVQKRED